MNRSAAGKSGMMNEVCGGSETAARLADYSGTQYYYISGRSTVEAELSTQSARAVSDVAALSLPPDMSETHSADSGSEKDTGVSKDHKTENPVKDLAKVLFCTFHHLIRAVSVSRSPLLSGCHSILPLCSFPVFKKKLRA